MSRPGLDIVIVNWNAGSQLRECLASVAAATRPGFEITRVVVVDNASTDGSSDGLETLALPLTVIRNRENRGFGAACNQGASGSAADDILFLNPDTRVAGDALAVPVAFLETHPEAGICGIRLVDEHGTVHRSCARHPRPRHLAARTLGLDRIAPRAFPGLFLEEFAHDRDAKVDHVMGAFLMIRRALFEELQGFDERFFVYLEDLDLTLRAKESGYETWFLAGASTYHRGGGTSDQVRAARLAYSLRSRMLYGHKHYAAPVALGLDALTWCVEPVVRIAASIVRGAFHEIPETLSGYARLAKS
ncbi:MAG TPA: glycosyltransferase family 2 protein [Candidatus Polarisedimenticolaceae bacterium]|nr:glycosyltransferase family 2 protein [Candidatus Polarisedimenticolaceae bacterium]